MNNNWTEVIGNLFNEVAVIFNDFMVFMEFKGDPVYTVVVLLGVIILVWAGAQSVKSSIQSGWPIWWSVVMGIFIPAYMVFLCWLVWWAFGWIMNQPWGLFAMFVVGVYLVIGFVGILIKKWRDE